MIRNLVLTLCCLLLAACGESNPLIGAWEGDVNISSDFVRQSIKAMGVDTHLKIEFTPKEMIVTRGDAVTRSAVRYRVEKGTVYLAEDTGKQEKNETWTQMPLKDPNTLEYSVLPGVTATLKRVTR